MSSLRQIAAVTAMNLRAVPHRLGASLVIVGGMAIVVGVVLSMLALAGGMLRVVDMNTRPGRMNILSQDAQNEYSSKLSRAATLAVTDVPGIKRDDAGNPVATGVFWGPGVRSTRKDGSTFGRIGLVGMGQQLLALYPEIHLSAGRMFTPGLQELIVGEVANDQYRGFEIGDEVRLLRGTWKIVGVFTGESARLTSMIGDADTLMATFQQPDYNVVVALLDGGEAARPEFDRTLAAMPNLPVRAEQESEIWRRSFANPIRLYTFVAYWLGGVMALGALFGAVNTMYTAVSARTREIATLRAVGFGPTSVVISVIAESMLLTAAGALAGAGAAWLLFSGTTQNFSNVPYSLVIRPEAFGGAIGLALGIGLLGALLPAIQAARMPVVTALQAR